MNVFIFGVGLIGGSLALDMKSLFPKVVIYGIDQDLQNLAYAKANGVIDHMAAFEDLPKADVVVLSVPVNVIVKKIKDILDVVSENCLVFDVGSTKEGICKCIESHPNREVFLAAHPIAGTEFSGSEAALHHLFRGKANILCEIEKTGEAQKKLALDLFKKMGMRIRYMQPAPHDKHIAYVSHLSHVSSFMLGKTVIEEEKNEKNIFDMAGSGFASTVRLAKSSPAMWTPIFDQNKDNVVQALEEYIQNLTTFKTLLETGQKEAIFEEMQNTNKIKAILEGINK